MREIAPFSIKMRFKTKEVEVSRAEVEFRQALNSKKQPNKTLTSVPQDVT